MSRAAKTERGKQRKSAAPERAAAQSLPVIVCGAAGNGRAALIGALEACGEGFRLLPVSANEICVRYLDDGAGGDVALVVSDADTGVDTQTREALCILSLLGVGTVALVVNKMDQAGFSQQRFEQVSRAFSAYAKQYDFKAIVAIPVASLTGENLVEPSASMGWYRGPLLSEFLASADVPDRAQAPLRMSIRDVAEGTAGGAECTGVLASGVLRGGDSVLVLPAGRAAGVAGIERDGKKIKEARAGDAVTVTLADADGVSAGDMLVDAGAPAEVSDQIAAHVVWSGAEPMFPGRSYRLTSGGQSVVATVSTLKHKINVDNLDHIAGPTLEQGEIGYCNLSLNHPIVFDPCRENRETGGFVLDDRVSGDRVGAGMIEFGLRRATNIHWQALDLDKATRAGQKGQRPCVLWFTGLSGAGKSTLASLLEKRLHARGQHTYVLDGDNVRHGLNRDLGFTDADRVENIRRVAETAKLMVDAGLIVMASFISPFRSERRMARELFDEDEFIEVFVDTPLDVCEQRDPKGLYKKAREGLIKNFTGIDSDYEPPENADIRLEAGSGDPDRLVAELIQALEERKFI